MADPVSAVIRLYAAIQRARLAARERAAKTRTIRRLDREHR
ncbi:hypothetical protein [Amycolatopsis kentuckyensis]|nr:hypothetical protein [Amycolatopsis kentuckyensis]